MPEDPYVYSGTTTLRNRYGVRNPAELARRETAASTVRLAELAARPISGSYDLSHLQASTAASSATSTTGRERSAP